MTETLKTRSPFSLLHDTPPGRLRWHLPELIRRQIRLRRYNPQSKTTPWPVLWLAPPLAGATRPVNHMAIGIRMVMPNPPSPRGPRVRALTPITDRHLSSCRRIHPLYLNTPHVANDRSTHPIPPNILPSTLPLLENLLEIPLTAHLHLASFLVPLLLIPFPESNLSSATRVALLLP